MKKVKRVDIILENCEVIEIPPEELGIFYLKDIGENISFCGLNEMNKYKVAKDIIIQLYGDLNKKEYKPFGVEPEWEGAPQTIFDRITEYMDVSAVDIIYEDGENDYIYVDYDEGCCDENCNMTCHKTRDLWIRVCQGKSIEECIGDLNNE